ncbi:phospholipase A [Flavobacterium ginsenosidimutans]|uniref:Phosphatidylcholine 1-acylhydrolase n=1 Tax=Flavobacterium ginsenosidimutans TaxID=687844 RepID=A0ABZ2Q7Y4_9FLAO
MDEKCLFLRCSHYLVMLLFGVTSVYAQQQSDSIRKKTATEIFLSQPNFSAYKDNYFITGVSLRDKLSKETSDIKYQISFKYLLSRKPLFDNVYSFITYTQKSFWKVYEKSSPFEDINFNPTIGVIRPYTDKKNRIGYYSLMFEHESNGRDSLQSRSWNFLSFNWQGQISNRVVLKTRILVPFVSGDNPDLLEYEGFLEAGVSYTLIPKKLYAEFLLQKGSKLDWKGALQTQMVYRPFKSSNQYIFLQWYHGYAEGLLDYRKETSMIRLGIIIKPTFMNFY